MKLDERKHFVLIKAVDDYIEDASPITSGNIKQKHIQNLSTATLRNELSALEAMGFLKQVHVSGGRVPTALGYRYYVNELLQDVDSDEQALEEVQELLEGRTKSLTEIISELAKLISKKINYPTVIYTNGYDKLSIENIKIFPLIDKQALALIQTLSGYITMTIQSSADLKSCKDASKFLTAKYSNKTIGEMLQDIEQNSENMIIEIQEFRMIVVSFIDGIRKILSQNRLDIHHEGSAELLGKNVETAEQAKKVLKLLDNESELEKALELDENQKDLTVTLVEEDKYSGCALVKAPLCIDGKAVASIGVLGPQRMNYASIASAIKVVMNELDKKKTKSIER
ncbi:MAG: heat-inducible transcriptional repressor HrcA [Clostridia bacterium]|nr:heat-inducible transcriptional repressor HrcA [Clostridia bacterium]MDD3862972.1 heat-inducible transcriptional repressor HrcA [Clostridia bacterium]MDD4408357.1 heat-inducible transcriptional repressor HrcA [Clostridia bacterium]